MKRNLLAIAAWISGLSLTLSLCAWGGIRQLEICFAGAAFCWGCLCFGKSARLPGRDGSAAVLALVSAGCIWPLLSWLRPENFRLVRWFVGERLALTGWAEPLCVVLSLWLIPALYGLVYTFFNGLLRRLRLIFSRMTRTDRLFWCVGWVLAAAGLVWLFLSSSAFYGAPVEQDAVDVLYTSDSGYLYQQNVYIHINAGENDIRQPLFGVFALPLSAPLWQLSRLLPYPAYPLLMGVLQAGMLLVCLVLLRQMLGIDGLLPLLCLAALYPVLLFGLMQEQYVFAMLWLMLLVDAHLHGEGDRGWLFGAAAGSMLTSSAFLPLCADWRSWKESLTQMLRALAVFLAMWMIFGRFGGLLDLTCSLSWAMRPCPCWTSCGSTPGLCAAALPLPRPCWKAPVTATSPGSRLRWTASACGARFCLRCAAPASGCAAGSGWPKSPGAGVCAPWRCWESSATARWKTAWFYTPCILAGPGGVCWGWDSSGYCPPKDCKSLWRRCWLACCG